jgi:hypothetical protein
MNKSVSELADVMFAFRTIGPNSLAAIMDWLGEHVEKARVRELAAQVRELDVGQALVVSPGLAQAREGRADPRARDVRLERDAEAGPARAARQRRGGEAGPREVPARMAATIEKAKADDPKELAGLVDATGGAIRATDAGVDALGADFEPLPTGKALQKYWLEKLSGGERAILEVLLQAYPSAVPRDEISERTEYKRSSRDTYIQRLGARKLVESVGRSAVRASATLF